jgi:hypothetical protein
MLTGKGNNFQQFEQINSFDPTGMTNSGNTNEWALMSYFGRLNYGYAGKYLFEANIRYDGSSRFANGYKWGLFPSFLRPAGVSLPNHLCRMLNG